MLADMARKVARRLGREEFFWDDDEPDEQSGWDRQTEKKLSRRAPKCRRVYDKATALQKKSRSGDAPACNDAAIAKAVLQAFAGPCKKAEKTYRKAIVSCKQIGR